MKSYLHQLLFGTTVAESKIFNIAWLMFRLHTGLSMAIHAGWPKMNSFKAPAWFVEQVSGLGFTFPSPAFWAMLSAWGEFLGGILIAIGLFTRMAAIQLAFQFFVIAFLWYEKPEPLTGMYFQHLLFWAYVLIAFGGGGKFSLDAWFTGCKRIKSMAASKIAIALVLLCLGMSGRAQSPVTGIDDFKLLQGNWEGTLSYEDYSSHKTVTIQATAAITIEGSSFLMSIDYPAEPGRGDKSRYAIAENGMLINNKKLLERSLLSGGILKIVLEEKGRDGNDNKPATFHQVWMISKNKLTISKMVKFDDGQDFFQRHQYVFNR